MISGIFENCIGTRDLEGTLKYWAEFGYREVQRGQLNAEHTELLYGHASNLQSIRLQNGNSSTHGLLRIIDLLQNCFRDRIMNLLVLAVITSSAVD